MENNNNENDYWLSWIIGDYTPFEFHGRNYFLSTPSRESKFLAEQIFVENYKNALQEGLLSEDNKYDLLKKYGLWNDEQQQLLDKLSNEVQEIKVQIFECYLRTGRRKVLKEALKDTNEYIHKLLQGKNAFNEYSAKSIAHFARQHFLLGSSIFFKKNKPLHKGMSWWYVREDEIINYTYKILSEYTLTEDVCRSLSRCSQWRNIWSASRGNVFGRCASDLSEPQKQLIMWTKMYDSVYKNSECPSEEIIEDADALDGWFITQKRKRDKDMNQNMIESKLPDKIRNSEEIYIMCNEDSISKVMDCNDEEAKMRWTARNKQIQKEGILSDIQLNDRKRELQLKIHERNKK